MPGLLTLGQSTITKLGSASSLAALLEYDDKDNLTSTGIAFQYFPESITDTKAINYQVRDIPGGSLPLYQWISSGERVVSFTAYFSSDVDLGAGGSSTISAGDAPSNFKNLSSQGLANRNLDVRTALLALRRYLFPTYLASGSTPGTPLTLSPRKLNLMFTGTGLGALGGLANNGISSSQGAIDGILCVMTQCDITIDSIFPSGLIRIASVQLSFAQISQLGGQVFFPNFVTSSGDDWGKTTVQQGQPNLLAPYPIQFKWSG